MSLLGTLRQYMGQAAVLAGARDGVRKAGGAQAEITAGLLASTARTRATKRPPVERDAGAQDPLPTPRDIALAERKERISYMVSLGLPGELVNKIYLRKYDSARGVESVRRMKSFRQLDRAAPVSAFNVERGFSEQIIQTLAELTDPANFVPGTRNVASPLPPNVYTEIPATPDFDKSPYRFEQYIHTLTSSKFHYKNSSATTGIIPKILMNLFHPLNSTTKPLKTVESYNDVIRYFVSLRDFQSVHLLFKQMKIEEVLPNTRTYNTMISSLVEKQFVGHVSNLNHQCLIFLQEMKLRKLNVDLDTWNVVFDLFQSSLSKQFLMSRRMDLGLPVDLDLVAKTFESCDTPTSELIQLIVDYKIDITPEILQVLVRRFLASDDIRTAWSLVYDLHKNEGLVDTNILNIFLDKFSEGGQVDLIITVINSFRSLFNTELDPISYNYVFRGLSRSRYFSEKRKLTRIYYNEMILNLNGKIAGIYWLERLRARYKFIYEEELRFSKEEITQEEVELYTKLKGLRWDSREIRIQDPELLKLTGSLSVEQPSQTVQLEPQEYKRRKERMSVYMLQNKRNRNRIFTTSKIPYSQDPFKALKNELKERDLIDK